MRRALRVVSLIVAILLILIIVGLVFAGLNGQLLNVLYVVLMILALFSLFSTALLIYAIVKLIQTILLVREEMRPLFASVNETVGVAKETAEAVMETAQHAGRAAGTLAGATRLTREYALAPAVRVVALAMGGRQMVRVLFGKGQTRKRAEERKRRQAEMISMEMAQAGEGE